MNWSVLFVPCWFLVIDHLHSVLPARYIWILFLCLLHSCKEYSCKYFAGFTGWVSELERNGPGGAQGGKRVKLPFYNSGGSSNCPGSKRDQPCKEDTDGGGGRAFGTDRGHLRVVGAAV
ncbi:hypothetical protein CHARACLAT_024223 [Characodon lateralis]|uniref:Secreted protein n=1 Tax=Characodon lateralis TaxID=208331 RepID=A0ABU7E329_9TELE|nr:hypothetical protein [Characodon lateralis]